MYLMMSQWMLYLSRGIDGAAALLIGMAAFEAAIRASGLLIHRRVSTESKERYAYVWGSGYRSHWNLK